MLEGAGVQPDLPLRHQTLLAGMDELDWIFDCNDVVGPGPVDEIYKSRQGGALARTGRPGDHDKSFGKVAEVLHLPAQTHFVGRADQIGNDAKDGHGTEAVAARVTAETRQTLDLIRPIGISSITEFADFLRRHDADQHRVQLIERERRVRLPGHLTIVAKHGRLTRAQVKIGGARLHQQLEK
jgi:hypothetical protein